MNWLSLPAAAKLSGFSIKTIRKLVASGAIPAITLAKQRRIDRHALLEWMLPGRAADESSRHGSRNMLRESGHQAKEQAI